MNVTADDLFACRECDEQKPAADMFLLHKRTPTGWCRPCRAAYRRTWYAANRERAISYSTAWKRANRDRWLDANRKAKYGIPYGTYATMLAAQDGGCAICGGEPTSKALHVDHNHETGVVRGLLCDNCNRGIGHLKESPEILRAAIAYLGRTA